MDAQGNPEHSKPVVAPAFQPAGDETFRSRDREAESLTTSRQECRRYDPIDMHVHIVGNGLRGSGCWLKIGTAHRPLAAFMLRHIGVGVSTRAPEFDEAYTNHLAKLVRESSLSAAVICSPRFITTFTFSGSAAAVFHGSLNCKSWLPNDEISINIFTASRKL